MNTSSDLHPPDNGHETADTGLATDRLTLPWRSIATLAALGALVSATVTLVRPAEYAARMSIFFPTRSASLGGGAAEAVSMASAASSIIGSGPSPLRIFEAFLSSETAISDFRKSFGMKRQDFIENRALDSDSRTNVLSITFIDHDPLRARKVLDMHVTELRKINSKVSFNTMEDDLKVLAAQLENSKRRMTNLDSQLVTTQRGAISAPTFTAGPGGIASTPAPWAQKLIALQLEQERIDKTLLASKQQIKALAKSPDLPTDLPPVRRLRPRILDLTYQLETKRRTLGPEAPEVTRIEDELQVARAELQKEIAAYLQGVDRNLIEPGMAPPSGAANSEEGTGDTALPMLLTKRVANEAQIAALRRLTQAAPGESMALNKLYRQVNLQAGIVQTLTNQYLMASLQAERDPNRWVILDDPWTDDRPTNKSYGRAALVGAAIGAILGVLFGLFRRPRP